MNFSINNLPVIYVQHVAPEFKKKILMNSTKINKNYSFKLLRSQQTFMATMFFLSAFLNACLFETLSL